MACWGWNEDGQASPPAGKFIAISAGTSHTCGVRDTGEVACWSRNDSGPEGTFTSVSAGDSHYCGLRDTGQNHVLGPSAGFLGGQICVPMQSLTRRRPIAEGVCNANVRGCFDLTYRGVVRSCP